MAQTPDRLDIPTEDGVIRLRVQIRPSFCAVLRVDLCWLHQVGIDHDCREWGCWPDA